MAAGDPIRRPHPEAQRGRAGRAHADNVIFVFVFRYYVSYLIRYWVTEPIAPTRTCRYPGCDRPTAAAEEGVGRPPEYCDDPAHTRGAAWRARRDARAVAGTAVPDDLDRPVSMARARAAEYAEQVTAQVLTLATTLNTVLEELRTLGDPDAAAVQIEAVTAEAEQRVAVAMARAARAEQDRGTAEQQRAEADAAAEEATAVVESLSGQLAAAGQAQSALQAEVDQIRQAHAAEIERVTAQLARARADADEQRARADAQAAEARTVTATLTAELGAARQRFEDERAHAETRLADQRAAYEARLADLRGQPPAPERPRNPRQGKTGGGTREPITQAAPLSRSTPTDPAVG